MPREWPTLRVRKQVTQTKGMFFDQGFEIWDTLLPEGVPNDTCKKSTLFRYGEGKRLWTIEK